MEVDSMRVAEISMAAIRHNVRHILQHTGNNHIIAVIKANGYGHGASNVAKAALEAGASLLGVTDLEEALDLRRAGITAPILCWLHGVHANMTEVIAERIEIGVSHLAQLERIATAARMLGEQATIQLKIDTGLSRNGAGPEEWEELFTRASALEAEGTVRVRGIFSHLANAGEDEDLRQAERFDRALEMLREAGVEPELVHLAGSAATLASKHLHYNTVRVGVILVGLSPFAGVSAEELGLRPAMTLKAEIVSLREVARGTGVSYGYNYRCMHDTTLALVPVGYADGMPRALNGRGATVTIRGVQCPIVGRIGMDQCIIDLFPLGVRASEVQLGDRVVLFGDPAEGHRSVDEWAELMHTINYEIVVGIGPRVHRVPVEEASS